MAKVMLNVRLDSDLKEAAEAAAIAGSRSVTGLVEVLLAEHCKKLGKLPEEWEPSGARRKP